MASRTLAIVFGSLFSVLMILGGIFVLLSMSKFNSLAQTGPRGATVDDAMSAVDYLMMALSFTMFGGAFLGPIHMVMVFCQSKKDRY